MRFTGVFEMFDIMLTQCPHINTYKYADLLSNKEIDELLASAIDV